MSENEKNEIKKEVVDLKQMIMDKNVYQIRQFVNDTPINEIINDLSDLSDLEVVLFFRFLTTEKATELFSHFDEQMQQNIIQNLTKKEIADIINELYTDEIADLLESLPSDLAKTILLSVDKTTRIKVNKILQYDDDEVGSIMSVDMISLNQELTNQQALELIKSKREDIEQVQFYFIVDNENKLLGSITLEDIVFANKDHMIIEKSKKVVSLNVKQLKQEAAMIFANEGNSVLPVVNSNNELMGMLTSDDVIDVLHEEATEDLYKASGISINQSNQSYLKASVFSLVKSRVFWLIILMIGSTLSQIIIQFFSKEFDYQIISIGLSSALMIALIPVTSATSGNAGSQTTSTLTRAVSLGEIPQNKYSYVIWKESKVGFVLGIILAFINYARLCVYYAITQDLINHYKFILLVSLVSSLSLLISIVLSKILGSSILILGLKTKRDPAVMASPVLTTLIDALSTLIFYALAYAIIIPLISFIK